MVHKIDLMSFSHIIMPINEKHHWYCCIIRGLPTLLEMIKLQKENPTMPILPILKKCLNDGELKYLCLIRWVYGR